MNTMRMKEVADFHGYFVTRDGEVWSNRRGGFKRKAAQLDQNGYPYVQLYNSTGFRNIKVHRLVMEAFCGSSMLHVNHINGVKTDNRIENLEYCTARENSLHANRTGLRDKANALWRERRKTFIGEKCGGAKLTDAQAAEIIALKGKVSRRKAMEQYGVSEATIKRIWYNKTFKHLPRGGQCQSHLA